MPSHCDTSRSHDLLARLPDREVRLVIIHLVQLTEWTIGEEAAMRMLDLSKDKHLADLRVSRVERIL